MEKRGFGFKRINKELSEVKKIMGYFELLNLDGLNKEVAEFAKANYKLYTADLSKIKEIVVTDNSFIFVNALDGGEFGIRFEPSINQPSKVSIKLNNRINEISYMVSFTDELTRIEKRRLAKTQDMHNGISVYKNSVFEDYVRGQIVYSEENDFSIGKTGIEDSSYGKTEKKYYSRSIKDAYVKSVSIVAEKRAFEKSGINYYNENGEITLDLFNALKAKYEKETVKEKKIGTIN